MGSTRIDTSVGGTSLLDHFDIQPATQANPFPFFQAAAECLQPTSLCITSQRKLVIDLKYEAAFLHLKLAVSSLVSTFAIVFFGAIASRLLTPLKVEFHWKVLSGGAFLLGAFLILRLPVDLFRNQFAVCLNYLLYHRE